MSLIVTNKINELHSRINSGLKKTVQWAVQIGGMLEEVKEEVGHGNFVNWVNDNCDFDTNTSERYRKLKAYSDKIPTVGNLQDAYRKVEQIEYQEKQTEQQRKDRLIRERMKTGQKPEGWDRSLDYEFKKRQQEEKERNERIEKVREAGERIQEQPKRKNSDDVLNEFLGKAIEKEEQKEQFRSKLTDGNDNQDAFLDVVDTYIESLPDTNEKREALTNIIKYCKGKIIQFERIA